MTAPSNANTSGLKNAGHIVWLKVGGVSYYPEGEPFTISESCRVEPLVTAASAQARIAELEKDIDKNSEELLGLIDQWEAIAASAGRRVNKYYDALVQADLLIRSIPGKDQSDVEFIRAALQQEPTT